jgi:hypothetical protein
VSTSVTVARGASCSPSGTRCPMPTQSIIRAAQGQPRGRAGPPDRDGARRCPTRSPRSSPAACASHFFDFAYGLFQRPPRAWRPSLELRQPQSALRG